MEKDTFLTFILGKELFAVNVANVLEVLEQQQVTEVPKAPDHIMGIINFRGDILPVVNTRLKFQLHYEENLLQKYIIVFEMLNTEQRSLIAATADAVRDVIEIGQDEIKPVPEMGISYDMRYIAGVVNRDGNFILLLNTEKVFSPSDLEVLEQSDSTIEQQNI